MQLLISWAILSFAVWITAELLSGFHVKDLGSAFVIAAIYGVLNVLLGWIFFTLFAVATLGLALLFAFVTRVIVNAIVLTITDKISDALKIDSFGWAMGGALMISALATAGDLVLSMLF